MKAGFVKLISFQQQKQKIRVLLEFVLLGSFCRMYIGLKLFYCVYSQGLGQQHFQLKIGVFFDVLLCHDIRVFASLSHLFMYSFILTKKLPFCRLLVFSLLLKLSLLENKIHLYFSISFCCQFSTTCYAKVNYHTCNYTSNYIILDADFFGTWPRDQFHLTVGKENSFPYVFTASGLPCKFLPLSWFKWPKWLGAEIAI